MTWRFRFPAAVGISAAISFGACGVPPQDSGPTSEVLVIPGRSAHDPLIEIREAWLSAHNAGDATRLASYFADDAVMLPDGSATVSGRAAIEEYLASDFATGISTVTVLVSEVHISGDLAVEWAEYEARAAASPNRESRRGKYVIAYKRTSEGIWQIQVDVWNADE